MRRFATLDLAQVAVDAGAVVTGPGVSGAALDRQLQLACVLQLCRDLGAIDRVLEFTVEWAFDRYSFGRPLASYQALKHRFADMRLWLEASMATTAAAVRAVQDGSVEGRRAGQRGQGLRREPTPRSWSRTACRCTGASG